MNIPVPDLTQDRPCHEEGRAARLYVYRPRILRHPIAKLRQAGAAVEDVDYWTPRKLDKSLFQGLATGRWIAEKRNLLITGPCSPGLRRGAVCGDAMRLR
jgi:hypothetical protein